MLVLMAGAELVQSELRRGADRGHRLKKDPRSPMSRSPLLPSCRFSPTRSTSRGLFSRGRPDPPQPDHPGLEGPLPRHLHLQEPRHQPCDQPTGIRRPAGAKPPAGA